jgi:hypothetical protein
VPLEPEVLPDVAPVLPEVLPEVLPVLPDVPPVLPEVLPLLPDVAPLVLLDPLLPLAPELVELPPPSSSLPSPGVPAVHAEPSATMVAAPSKSVTRSASGEDLECIAVEDASTIPLSRASALRCDVLRSGKIRIIGSCGAQ